MRLITLKLFGFPLVMLFVLNSSAQSYKPVAKVDLSSSTQELLKGDWDLEEAKIEIISLRDSNLTVAKEDSIEHLFFLRNECLFSEFTINNRFHKSAPPFLSYCINKDTARNLFELIFFEQGGLEVKQSFEIESFSFNRLILVKYNLPEEEEGDYSKTILNYVRRDEDKRNRSLGTWFHNGSIGIYNLEDTDSLEHHFIRVAEGQNIRDSVALGEIYFQIKLSMAETYSSFCTSGVLGSVNLGNYRIDLLNKRLYFFESDLLVYDYYINTKNELVLKLNQDLTITDN
ncbi:MAG: hypothetical protein ACI8ZM_003936 [Crocinitomix sp.]|jgi:hypothetical protein